MSAWKAGRVLWFDPIAGEGLVIDEDGISFYVHHSAIQTEARGQNRESNQNKLRPNSKVKFTVYTNSYSAQVEKLREV